jgi:hypothetical protein
MTGACVHLYIFAAYAAESAIPPDYRAFGARVVRLR